MLIYGQKRTAHANMSAHAGSQLLSLSLVSELDGQQYETSIMIVPLSDGSE
jgi:hypothetical protein